MASSSSDARNPDPEALKQVLESLAEYSIPLARIKFRNTTLGTGGFGTVRLAYLRSGSFVRLFEKPVTAAVKELKQEGAEVSMRVAFRLAREMKDWASCKHPNILEFWGFHLSEDFTKAYLVSPYMVNGNVKDYIAREAPPQEVRLALIVDTITGLDYLHKRDPPVVHGDLKTLNVLVNDNGRAMLSDFGLAKAKQSSPSGLSTSGGFKGSFRFSSPEALDLGQVGCPSDIWSWGGLAQEMMTGNIPYYQYKSEAKVIAVICGPEDLESPEEDSGVVPPPLLELFRRCWKFQAEERPTSTMCLNEMRSIYSATEPSIPESTAQSTVTLPASTTLGNGALHNPAAGTSSSSALTASSGRRSGPSQLFRIVGPKTVLKRLARSGKARHPQNPELGH